MTAQTKSSSVICPDRAQTYFHRIIITLQLWHRALQRMNPLVSEKHESRTIHRQGCNIFKWTFINISKNTFTTDESFSHLSLHFFLIFPIQTPPWALYLVAIALGANHQANLSTKLLCEPPFCDHISPSESNSCPFISFTAAYHNDMGLVEVTNSRLP